jgi:tetratricopeptide (TPR) repeat protein
MDQHMRSRPDAELRRAQTLHRESRLEEAGLAYQEVLRRQPAHLEALTFLSVLAFEQRQPERALELTARALQIGPDNAAVHLIRGQAQSRLRRYEAAVVSYDKAIALRPDFAYAHYHRACALAELGSYRSAVESYDAALAIDPSRAETHAGRGLALCELRRFEESLASFDRALTLGAAGAEVHLSRALALIGLRQFETALGSLDRAIAIRPDYSLTHANRGNVLCELERDDDALASFDAAVAIDPCNLDALCNRGGHLAYLHRFEEALASFDRALSIQPDHAHAHFGKAFVCLVLGDWREGWREFEWRFRNEYSITSREARGFVQPQWRGEPVAGKTILLHCEQGLGDTLQFCRFAKYVADRGARIMFEAPRALAALVRSLDGVDELVIRGEGLPAFDLHCPLLSLPLALNTTVANVPAEVPYLRPDAPRRAHWKARLGTSNKLRVGLVWSGGFRVEQPELWRVNSRRNIPLAKLAPLKHPGIEYYSLQKGEPAQSDLAAAIAARWQGPELLDFTKELDDFADTAALIEQLDLVISVDTSTAHLAGALGKPVWILNRFDTCWRWLLERSDTPWYPTARLYRQKTRGDWDGVIHRIRADLAALASPA